jgi:Ca2+-binding EF-hand superfamily protein
MKRYLLCWLAVALLGSAFGGEPAAPKKKGPMEKGSDLAAGAWEWVRQREFVEMLSAVASGSQMGPGDGWFKSSQIRYDFPWLCQQFDANGDGKVSREEFKGPAALFERLDRNRDGVLTADDFDWSDRSKIAQQAMPANMLFRMLDQNSNGRVSKEEWEALFKRAAKGKDHLTPDDLRDLFQPPRPQPNAKQPDGPSPAVLLAGLFNGELGSPFEGPALGQPGPLFTLKSPDGKETVSLKQLRGKPVVLIFGSFT